MANSAFIRPSVFHYKPGRDRHIDGQSAMINVILWEHKNRYWLFRRSHANWFAEAPLSLPWTDIKLYLSAIAGGSVGIIRLASLLLTLRTLTRETD